MAGTKNILVTGGVGYIGSHTVVELQSQGFNPVIVDDFRNSNEKVLDGIESITGKRPLHYAVDVSDYDQLKSVFEAHDFSGVIHFAAYKAVGESVDKPLMYYRNNIDGLLTCLELMEEFEVPNIVFSSSCTVYGEPDDNKVVTELTPEKEANSPYGATKQMCERILRDVSASGSKLNMLLLRYFNPVGAHPSGAIGELPIGKPNNLLPFVTQTAMGIHKELVVFGSDYDTPDGSCIRDFIHVVDLANAHIKGYEWLEENESSAFEVINVGTGKGTSVLEIIHTFEDVTGKTLPWRFGDRRPGDIEQIFADVTKANQLIGWNAQLGIKDAIKDAWNWEQKLRNE